MGENYLIFLKMETCQMMNKKMLNTLIIMLLTIGMYFAAAEENYKVPFSLGIYTGLNLNMQSPSFLYTTSATSPGPAKLSFAQNSTSSGLAIGALTYIPVTDIFTVSFRAGYNQLSGILDEIQIHNKVVVNYPDKINRAIIDTASVNQTLTSSLNYFEISPVLQFHNLLPVKRLFFLGGFELGIPIGNKYTLEETIRDIGNQTPTQFETIADNQTIPEASIRMALIFGAGIILNLNDKICLTPEITYRLPFSKVSTNVSFDKWDVPQLRLGFNLTYSFEKTKQPDPVPEAPKDIKLGFKEVRYYDNEGKSYPLKSVKVEDVQYTELFPLIPYIFFDEGITTPSPESQLLVEKSEAGEFNLNKLEPDAMKINKSTLDIIGVRMKSTPGSDLTITGTNDMKKESKNKNISLERAEFAKKYLVDNYGFNEERINIRTTNLPEKPSASSVEDGIAENRRIEFSSSNSKILEPIIIESDNQRIADPNLIEFIPYVNSQDSIVSWKMEINQSDKVLRKNTGSGTPPPAMQWGIHPNELTNKQIPVDYKLSVNTASGRYKEATGSIPVEYFSSVRKKSEILPDKTISKFSLILFDFDKSDVSSADQQIIDKYIVPAIKYNSVVKIYGYTDRIGDETYNQKLADKRANSVKELLEAKVKSAKFEVYGVGEGVQIFDNEVPVGRQLSRTVQIHVISPK